MEYLQEIGIGWILALQTLSPGLDSAMSALSFAGRIEFYLIVLPFIYWAVDRRLGLRLLLVLILADTLNSAGKLLLHQPRPYWLGRVEGLAAEPSYGAPSGHASSTISVWGYLAQRVRVGWLWAVVSVLILLVGLSRLYLGVHFPHDVLLGWLLGAALIWGFARAEARVAAWFGRLSLTGRVAAAFALSWIVIGFGHIVLAAISGVSDPAAWNEFSGEARVASHWYTLAGAGFGALAGYTLMEQYASFENRGSWVQRLERYVLGLVGVLILYFGLDAVFAAITPDETTLGYALRYLRYAVVALWAFLLAPWSFLKLGLAEAAREQVGK